MALCAGPAASGIEPDETQGRIEACQSPHHHRQRSPRISPPERNTQEHGELATAERFNAADQHAPGQHDDHRGDAVRLASPAPWLWLGFDLGLGPAADRPNALWDDAFVPMRLADALDGIRRADDLLRVSGHWVSPAEVEAALAAHPAVLEAAVIGRQDDDELVKPKAFVVLRAGATASRTASAVPATSVTTTGHPTAIASSGTSATPCGDSYGTEPGAGRRVASYGSKTSGRAVDTSTVDPSTIRQVGVSLDSVGALFCDCPVSGSVSTVEAGTLTIMAGGEPKVVAAVEPLLHVHAEPGGGPQPDFGRQYVDLHDSRVVHAIFRGRELMLGATPPARPRGLPRTGTGP